MDHCGLNFLLGIADVFTHENFIFWTSYFSRREQSIMNMTSKFQVKKKTMFGTSGKRELNEDFEVSKVPRLKIPNTGNILCSQYIFRMMVK